MFKYEDLLGKPFKYGGRGIDGYDCYTLTQEIYRRMGKNLPDQQTFTTPSQIHMAMAKEKGSYVELEKAEPGCVVALMLRPPFVSHVGVVLQDCYRFIHIMEKTSVCIERLDSLLWKRRVAGYYRFEG